MGKHTKKTVSGHIRPRPNKHNPNFFDVNIELGIDEFTGKRKRATFKAKTREEAERLLMEKKLEYMDGELLRPDGITVKEYVNEYFDTYVDGQLSPTTQRTYKNTFDKYIIPELGALPLQKLTTLTIQQKYNQWRTSSPANPGNPLAVETIKLHHRHFKAALNRAVDLGYIKTNPAIKVKIVDRGTVDKKNHVYSKEEFQKLQKVVKGTDMELIVALLFDCLLRREELLGLQWRDIDFEEGTVHIQRAYIEDVDTRKTVIAPLKTKSSVRLLKVAEYTLTLLRKQFSYHKAMKLQNGSDWNKYDFVICKPDGEQFLPHSMSQKWYRLLKKNGLRQIKLHGTRHSGITFLIEQGVPVNVVSKRAGHQMVETTLGIYTGLTKSTEDLAANALENVLFRPDNATENEITDKIIDYPKAL